MKQLIYADYNSTYPTDKEHLQELTRLLLEAPGNPSNIHEHGRKAKLLLEDARTQIASGFGKGEIIFTSGATEANNWMVFNAIEKYQNHPAPIAISAVEHPSIGQYCRFQEHKKRCTLAFLGVDKDCLLKEEDIDAKISKETCFVSLIHVNNETGAIQDIFRISEAIRRKAPSAFIHVDGVQAYGKLDLSWLDQSPINSYAVSGHKVGGIKGIGCLYLPKKGTALLPLLLGGGQERNRRSGTENMAGVLSMSLRAQNLSQYRNRIADLKVLKEAFLSEAATIEGFCFHGNSASQVPSTINFHLGEKPVTKILFTFESHGICASTGSACSSGSPTPSPVLKAMGFSDQIASNSIRLSFGAPTTKADIDTILAALRKI